MIILLIEDQENRFYTIINRLNELLEETNSGYTLKSYKNWKKGLDFFKENLDSIKLVILDVWMPRNEKYEVTDTEKDKTTGLDVYKTMLKEKDDVKVIFWTVLSKSEIEEHGIEVNDSNYVPKISDFSSLFSKIDDILGTKLAEHWEKILHST